MKNLFKNIFILLALSVFVNGSELISQSSYKDAVIKGQKEDKKVIMFIYSDFCPWCLKMEQTTLRDKKVVNHINENYVFLKVNQNKDIFPPQFTPRGVPATYVIDPHKEKALSTIMGYGPAEPFLSRLEQ